jgi:hypothetical protein
VVCGRQEKKENIMQDLLRVSDVTRPLRTCRVCDRILLKRVLKMEVQSLKVGYYEHAKTIWIP